LSNHPLNLAIRFLLELALVAIFAYWSWQKFDGIARYSLTFFLPVLGMLVWGIFKVEGDPGKAIVAIHGWTRILIEFFLFAAAFFMLRSLHLYKGSIFFLVITLLHYGSSYDRIRWLLKQ
jgi:hypothetical protein